MLLERSVERWAKCDPKVMQHMSPAAVYFAMQDAKHDIAALANELVLLRAQLAARDAALDAVLKLAKNWEHHGFVDYRNCGRELTAELLKYGVHPK